MELLLKTYNFSGSSSIHDKLMDEIKTKYEVVQSHAHFRGFILLTLCVCYLIFMGFENEENCMDVTHYIPILYSTVLVGITILFSGKMLHNWRRVILSVVVYFMVYIVLKTGNWECIANSSLSMLLFQYKAILLIGIIILPIIYQLFIYWLHSSIYKGYLKHHVHIEHDRFKKSMDGIKNRDKSKVDKIYMDAWTDAVFVSNEDPTLTSFYKVLNQQLLHIASPSYWQLLCSWISHHTKRLLRRRKSEEEMQTVAEDEKNEMILQTLSIQTETSHCVALDFTKEFREYCEWKKTAGKNGKLKIFCMANGISYKDMTAWLRVNKPDKQ
ncbi:MAG: hypothetical protein ACI3ZB_04055 [Prevotella sp.]